MPRCPTASDDCGRDLPDYRLTRPAAYRRRRRANVGEHRRAAVFGNGKSGPLERLPVPDARHGVADSGPAAIVTP